MSRRGLEDIRWSCVRVSSTCALEDTARTRFSQKNKIKTDRSAIKNKHFLHPPPGVIIQTFTTSGMKGCFGAACRLALNLTQLIGVFVGGGGKALDTKPIR